MTVRKKVQSSCLRSKAWTAIVYADSAPDNWLDVLADQPVECLVSPLHDKYLDSTKAHYHLLLSFDLPVRFDTAREVFESVNAVIPSVSQSKVRDFNQMARYFSHLD